MNLFQKNPSSMFYTYDDIICTDCGRKKDYCYEIMDVGVFCIKCFTKQIRIMNPNKTYIRGIAKEHTPKQQIKRERNIMTLKKRYEILKRDKFKCVLCGSTDTLEIDHKKPISKGGVSVKNNLQTLCFKCNRGKGVVI